MGARTPTIFSHSGDEIDVDRVRFSWKALLAIVGAVATVLSSFKAADIGADAAHADLKTRVSVVETKQSNDLEHRSRIQHQLDRVEEKLDRLLLVGR